MTGLYAAAREFLERELSDAEALGDRQLARTIGERICDVIEQEDFDECQRLDTPSSPVTSEEATGAVSADAIGLAHLAGMDAKGFRRISNG